MNYFQIKPQGLKLIFPLFICLSFIACRKVELNLDDTAIPVLISDELTGNADCDFNSGTSSCGDGFALIDICIECTACLTDDRLDAYRTVNIYFEALPRRDGERITTVTSGPNYDFQETICVPIIEGQESQIIGFTLTNVNEPTLINQYSVFDNITLNSNGVTKYHKDIVVDDLWDKPSCDDDPKIVWERDPTEDESANVEYIYCIVGSIGDCTLVSTPRSEFDIETAVETMKESYRSTHNAFGGVPCSGIYVSF